MQDEQSFHNKEVIQKHILFLSELKKIEERYIDYFKARAGRFIDDEHDYLHNHYNTRIVDGIVRFGIIENTDISKEIQYQCLDAFKKYHQS